MAQLGKLTVDLEANIASFTRDMGRASQQTDNAMQRMQGAANLVRNSIVALGGAATVGAFAVMVKNTIDAADNLRDLSAQTGIAVETLNGLGFAASQSGGSLESMASAAVKLNKSIAEAAGGKGPSAAFRALGIEVNDASGKLKKADVVMAEVADKFATFADGPEKSALAMELFGKSGSEMIPLLNEGGDAMRDNIAYAERYGGVTADLAAMSDEFNDKMGKLTVQQHGFANAITEAVLPVLNLVADEMLGASEQSNKFALAGDVARTVLETFVVVGSEVAFTFKAVGTEIGGIAAQLAALAQGDWEGFKFIGKAMKEDAEQARKEHDAFIKSVLDRTPRVVGATTAGTKPAAPRIASGESDDREISARPAALITDANVRAWGAQQRKITNAFGDAIGRAMEEEFRAIDQNEREVEDIRQSMLSQAQVEDEMHTQRMEALQQFHDAKAENIAAANAQIEAEVARHEQAKADIAMQTQQSVLFMAQDSAAQLYDVMKQAGMEQTALGKTMFLAQKALAVAQIIMNTNAAAAAALAPPPLGLGPVAGVALSGMIKAMGYASAGMTAGLAIAEASAEGGYDIPAGVNPVTQLHEKEMVLPKAQADVIRGLAANGGARGGTQVTYAPVIQIDSRTDQQEVRKLVVNAVQQGNADLVDKLQRAGRI